MIVSFACAHTQELWETGKSRKLSPDMLRVAFRKLVMINDAADLQDLEVPPGNHLERLKGDRKEQCSIRVNKRWRICFVWDNGCASNVEIVDYH